MHFLSDSYDVSAVCSPGSEHEQFKAQGLITHAIPIERRITPLRDVVSLFRLYCFLRRERPYIVHTMTPKAGLLGTMAAWAAGVPVRIAMFNGELQLPNKITRAIVRITNALTCSFATHLNADGFGTRDYVLEQRITRKPVTVFLFHKGNINGIDLTQFCFRGKRAEMRAALRIADSTLVYMFVGRIMHDKGIDELIPAFLALRNQGKDVALVLVGAEERELDPIAPATREAIVHTPDIYAVGRQNNVPDWLEATDVFVLPSHREGCNCSLLEAGAMGLPSIATDIRGCRDIVQHGVNGLLVSPKDKKALLEAMLSLYESADLRRQLTSQSRAIVEKNFDRKDVWREMVQFYEKILPENSSVPLKFGRA